MRILNTEFEDFHLHSSNYSDGLSSIDEIARFAGTIGMKKLIITDHSQAMLDRYKFGRRAFRGLISGWRNVFNDVDVSFGVEGDLLNPEGDICTSIGHSEEKFVVLSYHADVYEGAKETVAQGFTNAIKRFGDKINIIGHVCAGISKEAAEEVITQANSANIPVELNARYFAKSPETWDILLKTAKQIYINSDAHTLYELKTLIPAARNALRERGIL